MSSNVAHQIMCRKLKTCTLKKQMTLKMKHFNRGRSECARPRKLPPCAEANSSGKPVYAAHVDTIAYAMDVEIVPV